MAEEQAEMAEQELQATEEQSVEQVAENPQSDEQNQVETTDEQPVTETAAEGDGQEIAQQSEAEQTLEQADDISADANATSSVELADMAMEKTPSVSEDTDENAIDLLKDVELNVKIELGRTKMYVEDVLRITEGSVVELDKLAGDPVDIYVNEKLVARGEVLVLNENFCVRVNQIVRDVV